MMRVLIIGGGVGGLAAGLALARAGLDVAVHERAEALEDLGAGLQISPNGGRILEGWGLEARLAAVSNHPDRIDLRLGRSGGLIAAVPLGHVARARYGAAYRTAHRADLIALLAQALDDAAPGALHLNSALTGLEQTEDEIRAHFEDGRLETADALIGADGIRSTVQRLTFDTPEPRRTGHVAWRGVASTDALPAGVPADVVTAAFGPKRHCVTYPVRAGALMNFVAVTEDDAWLSDDWSAQGDPDMLRAAFQDWTDPVASVLAAAETTTLWAIYDRPPLKTWTKARVALLGDAAHPMAPYLAQGAVQALEDADELARRLSTATAETAAQALSAYARARQRRATRVQRASWANGRLYHARSGLEQFASYAPIWAAARVLPRAGLLRYDWLFDHSGA